MRFICAIWLGVVLLAGCRKSDRDEDHDLTLAEDAVNVQPALFEVFLATHESCLSTPGIKSFISCASITSDTLGVPRTMHIDFGTSGCSSPAGRTRTGKIIVYQNGYYSQAGSTSSIYFDTFYINGYNYSGRLTISNLGGNTYTLSPDNLLITSPGADFTYLVTGNFVMTQTGGMATMVADDDVFSLNGSVNVTGRKGNTGSCQVTGSQPLVLNGSCSEPVSGTMNMSATGQTPRIIDFGSGNCDQKATVTANTVTSDLNISF